MNITMSVTIILLIAIAIRTIIITLKELGDLTG